MDYGNLDKMMNAWKNRQNPETCSHDWDYMVVPKSGGTMFVEICTLCFDMRGTIERFV